MAMPHHDPIAYRKREIPWLQVVRFHKEIIRRDEESFFALTGRDDQSERWTSLGGFQPVGLAGPWMIQGPQIRSRQFKLAVDQGQHQELYLGGPCTYAPLRSPGEAARARWCPLLYREVQLRPVGDEYEIVPGEGQWSFTPLLYRLLHRLEVLSDNYLDELVGHVVEKAVEYSMTNAAPLSETVYWALYSEVPEAEGMLIQPDMTSTSSTIPTPWVLFAPVTRFSALTRHLMQDYDRLEELLEKDPGRTGGLRLLESQPDIPENSTVDVLPVVPLNGPQLRAVSRILQETPLTVISGPPGTGKSQVVVSALLNAWAQGKTVLFASNNNKAVDVVRERIERYESEFPIAVRAGSKEKRNIQEVLRRTLNMVGVARSGSGSSLRAASIRQQDLLNERKVLEEASESELPQRINEARSTALRAYAQYCSHLAEIDTRREALRSKKAELGFDGLHFYQLKVALTETQAWLAKVDAYKRLVREDGQKRAELNRQIASRERKRNQAVEDVGLSSADIEDWRWLLTGPSPSLVADWEQRIRSVLEKPIEYDLEPVEWNDGYSRWGSAEEAHAWSERARQLAGDIQQLVAELEPRIQSVTELKAEVESGKETIRQLDIPETISISEDTLRGWLISFAQYTLLPPRASDRLPWSQRSRLLRQLRRLEGEFTSQLPLRVWNQIGVLDGSGRARLSQIVEATLQWVELRSRWESAMASLNQLESRFGVLRAQAASLLLNGIPQGVDSEPWLLFASSCLDDARLADEACEAWEKRANAELAAEKLRSIGREWISLAAGVPIREAWLRGHGADFDQSVRHLVDRPDPESVVGIRSALYSGALTRLIEHWRAALGWQEEIVDLEAELSKIAQPSDRVAEWWDERPESAFVLHTRTEDWPDFSDAMARVAAVSNLCAEWTEFSDVYEPTMAQKSREELAWATDKLKQALDMLPPGPAEQGARQLCAPVLNDPGRE